MKQIEKNFEHLLFSSRWLMAPVYFGLVLAMLVLLVKFTQGGLGSLRRDHDCDRR